MIHTPPPKNPKTYTPQNLDPITIRGRVHGTPGAKLRRSPYNPYYRSAGVVGEKRFGKALTLTGVTETMDTFFSVPMPRKQRSRTGKLVRDKGLRTDVDCVLTLGDVIVLVDVKMFKNTAYYTTHHNILVGLNKRGETVTQYRMSQNMRIAVERFQCLFPNKLIIPAVVLIPTSEQVPQTLGELFWVGGIKIYVLHEFMFTLHRLYDALPGTHDPVIIEELTNYMTPTRKD